MNVTPVILAVFVMPFLVIDGRASGPVANGPVSVAPGKPCVVNLSPGGRSGTWTIAWGDGQADKIPSGQETAVHVYRENGVYLTAVTFGDPAGAPVTVRRDYEALVREAAPLFAPGFDEASAPERVSCGEPDGVKILPSPDEGPGRILRLNGKGGLRFPGQVMRAGDFFGLEFWFKAAPGAGEGRQVVFAGAGGARGNAIVYFENGCLSFELAGGGRKTVPLAPVSADGAWHHFGVSYERSRYYPGDNRVRFYQDGRLRDEQHYEAAQALPVNYTGALLGACETGGAAGGFLQGELGGMMLHPQGIFPEGFLQREQAVVLPRCEWRVLVGATGAETYEVASPVISHEVPVPLDADPATDNLPALQAAVDSAAPGTRLKIVDKKTGLGGGRYYLRSHDAHWKLLTIRGKTDMEIDGNGAGFVVRYAATKYLSIEHCERLKLENMSFDIDQTQDRPGVYARVEETRPEAGLLRLQYVQGDPLRPDVVPASLQHWRWREVDGVTRHLASGGFLEVKTQSKQAVPGDGSRWVFTLKNAPGDALWGRLAALRDRGDLLQINNARFGGSGATLGSSRQVTFDRVNFYGVMGMAFLSWDFDYLKICNCTLGLPPGLTAADRPFASCADGFHFHDAGAGHFIFENNDVGMTDDDPISIKDGVFRDCVKRSPFTLRAGGGLKPGTVVELRAPNLDPLVPVFVATVTACDEKTKLVTLDKTVPGETGAKFNVIEKSRGTANWIIRGNHFHDLNGRMMIYTHDGTVENNRFDRVFFHIGFSSASFDNAGQPYNIMVRNNELSGSMGDTSVWGSSPTTPIIEDVALIGNSMIGCRWSFNSVNRLAVLDNYFEAIRTELRDGAVRVANHTTAADFRGNVLVLSDAETPLVTGDRSSRYTTESGGK